MIFFKFYETKHVLNFTPKAHLIEKIQHAKIDVTSRLFNILSYS